MSSYVVLARRWRPKSFAALVGQEHVCRALQNALIAGRIPHAFLFSGIRGVGKTTLARLLAMCLNCSTGITPQPCGVCGSCLEIIAGNHPDVMEVDAASRTKVDQMRELLDLVSYTPTSARFKIFILDEVHMLSTQSFNALLKTLEEPPEHVKFLFATTENRKIPATIRSRCQRYELRRVPLNDVVAHMTRILESEQVPFDGEGLTAVARAAEGSVRDALSLLDQVISHGNGAVRLETVRELLGLTDRDACLTLLDHMLQGRGREVLASAQSLGVMGVEPDTVIQDLLDLIHLGVRMKVTGETPQESVGDEVVLRLRGVASAISQEHLQMAFMALQKGALDLRSTDQVQQSLEMLLLRVAHLKPIPSLDRLISSLQGGGASLALPGVAPATQKLPPQIFALQGGSAPLTPPSVTPAAQELPPQIQVVQPERQLSRDFGRVSPSHGKRVDSWEQLIAFVAPQAPDIAMQLRQKVACLDYRCDQDGQPVQIELQLRNDCFGSPGQIRDMVLKCLVGQGMARVPVTVHASTAGPRPETLSEKDHRLQKERLSALEADIRQHPVVRDLSSRFQAEVLRVDPVSDGTAL